MRRTPQQAARGPWGFGPAVLAALLTLAAPAGGAGWEPPGWRVPSVGASEPLANPAGLPLLWAVRAYQRLVSPVDGDRCPSYPTCSAYAREAVASQGPLLGFLLTAGRLLGEADEAAFAGRIFVDGRAKVDAPLERDLAFRRGELAP